jgi:hypothetical protein
MIGETIPDTVRLHTRLSTHKRYVLSRCHNFYCSENKGIRVGLIRVASATKGTLKNKGSSDIQTVIPFNPEIGTGSGGHGATSCGQKSNKIGSPE